MKVEARAAKGGHHTFYFGSLKELTDMFEDYEEPKEYWYVDTTEGSIVEYTQEMFQLIDKERKEIGNYFATKKEAEEAVEKLKAWKRLKDKGFKFERWQFLDDRSGIWVRGKLVPGIVEELDILFGGEE